MITRDRTKITNNVCGPNDDVLLYLNLEQHRFLMRKRQNIKTTQCEARGGGGSRKQNMFTQNFPPDAADILTWTLKEQTQKQQCFLFLKTHSQGLMTIISNISTSEHHHHHHHYHRHHHIFQVTFCVILCTLKSILV